MLQFSIKTFLRRVLTVATGAGFAAFSFSFSQAHDVPAALRAALSAVLVGLFGGATYDFNKFHDANDAAIVAASLVPKSK